MTRLNLVLLLAVLGSAFYLVHLQYESRSLYVALERARTAQERLNAEHEQLVAQRGLQATPGRVQQQAVSQLKMRSVNPGITEYVALPVRADRDGVAAGQVQVFQGPVSAEQGRQP